LPTAPFDALVADALKSGEVDDERDLNHRDLRTLTLVMLDCYRILTGNAFPEIPRSSLSLRRSLCFASWDATKAVSYRRLNGIDDKAGTAVTVQTIVFGNAGGESGAGVAFQAKSVASMGQSANASAVHHDPSGRSPCSRSRSLQAARQRQSDLPGVAFIKVASKLSMTICSSPQLRAHHEVARYRSCFLILGTPPNNETSANSPGKSCCKRAKEPRRRRPPRYRAPRRLRPVGRLRQYPNRSLAMSTVCGVLRRFRLPHQRPLLTR
jgi:hypothetical protein